MDEIINDLRAAIAATKTKQQQEYAAIVGVPDGTISRALSGLRPVDSKTAAALGYDRVRVISYRYVKRIPASAGEADTGRVE